jgi:hypothetical protein
VWIRVRTPRPPPALTGDGKDTAEISKDKHMNSEQNEPDAFSPRREGKGYFRKVTITLLQNAYELLVHESSRRKIAGKSNHLLSALMREALQSPLGHLDERA